MGQNKLAGKKCYDHLGGKLGAALLELYLSNGWLEAGEGKPTAYSLTKEGAAAFAKMGLRVDAEAL